MNLINKVKTSMHSFSKDQSASSNVVKFYLTVLIASIVALSVLIPTVITQIEAVDGELATGTFTFSGNTTVGEFANITVGGTNYCFYFNVTAGKPIGCLVVNVQGKNNSQGSANTLTTAINGDTDLDGLLIADNSTLNVTTVTALAVGTSLNSYVLSDSGANIASAGMSGGVSGVSATTTTILNLFSLFIALGILLLFMRPLF